MRRNVSAVALLIVVILGAAVLASAVTGHATGAFWGGPPEPCRVVVSEDCSVAGQVRTEDSDVNVSEDIEIRILFGPRSVLEGNVEVNGTRAPTNLSVDTDGPFAWETVVMEAGSDTVHYKTPPVGGYVEYLVMATVSNSSSWSILTDDLTRVPTEMVVTWPGIDNLRPINQRSHGVAVATVSLDDPPPSVNFELRPIGDPESGGSEGGEFGVSYLLWAIFVLGLAAATVFVGTVLSGLLGRHGDEFDLEDDEAAEIGRIAGDVADAIEQEAADANAVYRAWDEMTAALEVTDPDTTTPREFADAAIDAGLAPSDVRALTGLFEVVRYGDADPEEYEEEALATLRRIEDSYATREDADERGDGA